MRTLESNRAREVAGGGRLTVQEGDRAAWRTVSRPLAALALRHRGVKSNGTTGSDFLSPISALRRAAPRGARAISGDRRARVRAAPLREARRRGRGQTHSLAARCQDSIVAGAAFSTVDR